MAVPSAAQALKVRGRFAWNPTDLSTAYPHGGTALGLVRAPELRVRAATHVVRAEEHGGIPVDAVYAGEEYLVGAVLSGWDKDALTAVFLDTVAGATTGRMIVRSRPNTDDVRAGTLVSSKAGILYFSPFAAQHPGVLVYKALPMLVEQTTWSFNLAEEFGIAVVWLAVPDDDGNPVIEVGLREDLSV